MTRWRVTWWGWRQGPGSAGPVAGRPGLRHGYGSTWRPCTCPARATRASSALESVPAEMLTKSTSHAIIRIRNKLSNQNYVLSFALFGFLIFYFGSIFRHVPEHGWHQQHDGVSGGRRLPVHDVRSLLGSEEQSPETHWRQACLQRTYWLPLLWEEMSFQERTDDSYLKISQIKMIDEGVEHILHNHVFSSLKHKINLLIYCRYYT